MNTHSSIKDIELAALRDGFPALAAWIARDSDDETLIFRHFRNLAARNILHLQAQLVALEQEILDADAAARRQNAADGAFVSSMRWETMMKYSKDVNRPEHKRVQDLDRLRGLLRDYYEALLQRAEVAKLQRPSERTLAAARDFVKGTAIEGSNMVDMSIIKGRAQSYLDDDLDLVTLSKPAERDHLSRMLHACWPAQGAHGHDPFDRTTTYKNAHISQAVSAMGLILAAVLLIGAIIHLYFVVDPAAKLGFLTMYTMLFAMSVTFCTNARRVEVFAATAAYAAVLVVFVSGDLGGNKAEQCLVQLESGIFKICELFHVNGRH